MKLSTTFLAAASARHPWRVDRRLDRRDGPRGRGDRDVSRREPHDRGRADEQPRVGSRRGDARLAAFPPDPATAVSDIVVIRSEEYTVDSPQFEAFVRDFVDDPGITALEPCAAPISTTTSAALVSEDRHATMIPVALFDDDETEALVEKVEDVDEAAFAVSVTGEETLDYDFDLLSQEDLENGELKFGLPAALIILLLVFGAVVAGLVPLLMAIVSIVVALGLTALVAQQFELSVFVINMLTGMGLALGIDYSLFVVSRYREERGQGKAELAAIEASGATASRAVLFSGSVFVVAMFGMLLVPNSIMRSLAVGAILVGIVSVIAALTLLPAVLGLLGDKVNALRIPFVGRRSLEASNPEGRFWGAILRRVLSRPVLSLALSAGLLVALALPVLRMDVGHERRVRAAGPLRLQARLRRARARLPGRHHGPGRDRRLERLCSGRLRRHRRASRRPSRPMHASAGASSNARADGDVALLSVPRRRRPVRRRRRPRPCGELRTEIVPETFGGTDAAVLVGGTSSETSTTSTR